MKLNTTNRPLTRLEKLTLWFIAFVGIIFFSSLGGGFLKALSTSLLLIGLFGMCVALFKKHAAKDARLGVVLISFIIFIVSFFVRPLSFEEQFTSLSISILIISLFLAVIGLVKPILFGRFSNNTRPKRSKLLLLFSGMFVISLIGAGMNAPASLSSINLQEDQEVLSDTYTVKGRYSGSPTLITVNGEPVQGKGTEFTKEIKLAEGPNDIEIILKKEDETVHSKVYKIYYDYEGSLYAEVLKQEQRTEAELKKKLSHIPTHEIVRKDSMTDGFSAIVYIDSQPEDFLISNLIKHIRDENGSTKNISLLVFQKSDKVEVETILNSTDLTGLSDKVRANYEKRTGKEDLFLFPSGINGSKLALEV